MVDPSQIMRNFNRDLYINLNFQFFILVVRVCSYPQYPGGNIDVYDWGHSGEMRSAILKIPFYNMFSLSYPNLRIYWILFLGHSPQVSSRTSTRKQRRVLCPRALPLVSIFFAFGWFHKSTTNCPRADFMNCFSKVGAPVLWNPMEKYHSNIIQRNSSVQGDAILEMANALHSTRTKSHPNRWCQVTSPAAKFTRLLVLCPWCHHVYLSTTQKTFTCAQLALMMLHINSHSLRQTWTQRKNAWLWMSTGQIEPMRNIDKLYIYIYIY